MATKALLAIEFCPICGNDPAKLSPIDEAAFVIDGKLWKARHSIWSVRNIVDAIVDDRCPELGGKNALTSLECVSAVYESHFTERRVHLPMTDRRHSLVKRIV